jgi:hypothetical protein
VNRREHMVAYNASRTCLPPGEVGFRELLATYKRQAKQRGFRFSLTTDVFRTLTESRCHYCGVPPRRTKRVRSRTAKPSRLASFSYRYNGLDRVDNELGYIFGNVVTCCAECNSMKGRMCYDEFIGRVKAIARHVWWWRRAHG